MKNLAGVRKSEKQIFETGLPASAVPHTKRIEFHRLVNVNFIKNMKDTIDSYSFSWFHSYSCSYSYSFSSTQLSGIK